MGHLICDNKLHEKEDEVSFRGLAINGVLKEDTIVASKKWVRENLDKVKEWADK